MNKILVGIGVLLFIAGLVEGIFSVTVMVYSHPSPTANFLSYGIDAIVAVVFMVLGGLMVFFGIKKF